ncbi:MULTISPECIES: hypothetical protein [unclassified Bradyrhizobium]|uniref:hypothetical protein n=1 Tax=unclassified Bradyrhizobium TaxID=2631580 RepID=UPI00188AF3D4|nr:MULTISPECIES: hypothetical protein [unclassified Bradyrhizobium]MDN4986373.1 hypothetical protein [Bradyrhizobium sp. WYCCWR 13022]
MRQLQLIQIVGINAETLAEPVFRSASGPRVNPREAAAKREKGGVRIAEAAFKPGKTGVLALMRFTAR